MTSQYEQLRAVGKRVDFDLAVQCVELSKVAYTPSVRGKVLVNRMGYTNFFPIGNRKAYVFIVSDDKRHFVVFRGTASHRDWLTNLSMWSVGSPFGPVHSGFYSTSCTLLPAVINHLRALPPKPLVFTGHSMGGAQALLTSLTLTAEGWPIDGVYTFGQPKTGTRSLSRYVRSHLNAPYFRFVHGADAIAAWGLGAKTRFGTACYFDVKGQLQFGHHLGAIPTFSLRLHRLEHYRFYLRLNRLKLNALVDNAEETSIQA
jgi:pimeloyl-ACP methyl ester carboxylesterase